MSNDRQPVSGKQMHDLMTTLYPICRSITGNGVRETLRIYQQQIPLTIHEVPSGTPVFDWTVPDEWNIRDAYVANARGERVIDFRAHSLHVLNYSIPFRGVLTLTELKKHLHTLPDRPDWIPYKTSYYNPAWGFCLRHNDLLTLEDGDYEVVMDTTLQPGSLTYGELVLPGETNDEVLLSTHICHPSLCNDNLSANLVAVWLAQYLQTIERRYTYRFLFIPGTIGAITWLALHEAQLERIKHGLVLTNLGDSGSFTYKKTRTGDAEIDRIMQYVVRENNAPHRIIDFYPYGYDERQYNSPGILLPVGGFFRSEHNSFPEYHTSGDNLSFVSASALEESLEKLKRAVYLLEHNRRYINLAPKGEPQLGKRGIYKSISELGGNGFSPMAMFWVLNFSDGEHDLLAIAQRSGIAFDELARAVYLLKAHDLLTY
jgi:aminopeptidase-like protein